MAAETGEYLSLIGFWLSCRLPRLTSRISHDLIKGGVMIRAHGLGNQDQEEGVGVKSPTLVNFGGKDQLQINGGYTVFSCSDLLT